MQTRLGFFVGLGLGLAFSLGFAVASWTTPRAEAQVDTPAPAVTCGWPSRWEYQEIRHGWDDGRWAREAGAQGWRYVTTMGGALVFERPAH
jgi:hypothetical protein